MSDSLSKTLPGTVCSQMVRCGKVNCKCQRGSLHGPYFYRFWWEDGRLRKQYVPRSQVKTVTELCDRRRREQRDAKAARQLASGLASSLKQIENTIHDLDSF